MFGMGAPVPGKDTAFISEEDGMGRGPACARDT